MTDSRKDQRTLISIKIRYKSASLEDFIERYSHDISRGGVFVKSKNPLSVGTLMKFEFQLEDHSSLIHGVGRVVWRRSEEEASESSPAGMGVKFIKLDPESRTRVQQIVGASAQVQRAFESGVGPTPAETDPSGLTEDRTAVRHVSEFLASALMQGDAHDAAQDEAQAEVAQARRASTAFGMGDSGAPSGDFSDDDADHFLSAPTRVHAYGESDEPDNINDQATVTSAQAYQMDDTPTVDPSTAPPPGADLLPEVDISVPAGGRPLTQARAQARSKAMAAEHSQKEGGRWLPMLLFFLVMGAGVAGAYYVLTNRSAVEPQAEPAPIEEAPTVEPAPAPAPPPAPASTRALMIKSNPPGATVQVNGEAVGKTPIEAEVPVGAEVAFSTKLSMHAPDERKLMIQADTPDLEITLRPLQYILRVTTRPAGARVAYAGQVIARTPGMLKFDKVPKARSMSITRAGHFRVRKTVRRSDFVEQPTGLIREFDLRLRAVPVRKPKPATPPPAAPAEPEGATATDTPVADTAETPEAPSEAAPADGATAVAEPSDAPGEPEAEPDAPAAEPDKPADTTEAGGFRDFE